MREEEELILLAFHRVMGLFFHFRVVDPPEEESFLHELGALKLLDGLFVMDGFFKGYEGISLTHEHGKLANVLGEESVQVFRTVLLDGNLEGHLGGSIYFIDYTENKLTLIYSIDVDV